jgi:hypothetical protein
LLTDAIHATRPLDQTNDGPGQVVVDDDGTVLHVLPFTQNIRRDDDPQLVGGRDPITLFVAHRAEAVGDRRRVFRVTGDPRNG